MNALFLSLLTTSALAADLRPNAALTFDFPELPNTLAGMVSGTTKVPRLGAILPSNYAPGSQHPLFVYIKGGSGGPEDGGAMARDIVGAEDFIAVQLPLFKQHQPQGRTLPVMVEDLAIVSAAYRTMLEKLAAEVPNIDWKRSVIGGHSNGAHTLSVLLAGRDEFITQHFHAFWLHEGGVQLMPAAMPIKDSRFLLLVADDALTGGSEFRQWMLDQTSLLERQARLMKVDFQSVVMHGYGHDVPPEYMRNVRQFARGEPLEDITASEKAAAAKLTLPLRTHPDSGDWNDLLVLDLTNMRVPAGWSYQNGILSAATDQPIWTKAAHGDSVLDFEFRSLAEGRLLLHNRDEQDWQENSLPIPLQGQPGEWNRMTVTSLGASLTVVLNGEVLDVPASALRLTQGQIGFQSLQPDVDTEFRHVKLLRLASTH